eukprot:2186842-Alexandrium_andersonii.AAC.1
MLLRPNWRRGATRAGLGCRNSGGLAAGRIRDAIMDLYEHINRSGLTPLKWHRSRGGALRKSAAAGPRGKRVVH